MKDNFKPKDTLFHYKGKIVNNDCNIFYFIMFSDKICLNL